MKFTKKPVTIEAVKFITLKAQSDKEMFSDRPEWLEKALNYNNPDGYPHIIMEEKTPGDYTGNLTIQNYDGLKTVTPGDYIVRESNGNLSVNTAHFFETNHNPGATASPIEHLMKMQNDIGYVKGPINVVALLGLFGEAGEVLAETVLVEEGEDIIKACDIQKYAIDHAREVDWVKKQIRDKKVPSKLSAVFAESGEKFDIELADEFYYLLALAQNRGLTLDQLAAMSIVKIQEKRLQQNISHATKTN